MDLKEYEKKASGLKEDYKKEAENNYEKYIGEITGRHNNDYDAYRHAYVSAKLTELALDNQWAAEMILDNHEVDIPNTPYEHRMDGWNNEVGRRFGDEYSSEELGKKLADELKEGGLLATSPDDKRLEALYSDDPKIKDFNSFLDNKSTFGAGKEAKMGVTEEAMDKITDDASTAIDKLMGTREKELNDISKEALPSGMIVNDKDIGLDIHTYDSAATAQEIANNVYAPQENYSNNYGMEIGD